MPVAAILTTAATIFLLLFPTAEADLDALVIGDWGHAPLGQNECGAAMGVVAGRIQPSFVLSMGDNLYADEAFPGPVPGGADGAERFQRTYEQVYNASSLADVPWYTVSGNADWNLHCSGPSTDDHSCRYNLSQPHGNVSAEMAYAGVSARWHFPYYWYDIKRSFVGSADSAPRTLQVVFMDTIIAGAGALTPTLAEIGMDPTLQERQWAWLEATLAASTADYLLVVGHFPVYSIGTHGSTPFLIHRLKPLLEEHSAIYLAGHDHNSEHIVVNSTHYVVAGAGYMCCYDPSTVDGVSASAIQFAMAGDGGGAFEAMPRQLKVQSSFATLGFQSDFLKLTFYAHGTLAHNPSRTDRI